MIHRSLTATGALAGALLFSAAAAAAPGSTTGTVNMRTGPGTQYPVITTIPAGAPIEVFGCQSWCQVGYAGQEGYVSGSYVASGYGQPVPQAYYQPAPLIFYQPVPRAYYYGYYGQGRPYYWPRRHFWGNGSDRDEDNRRRN